jgi:hypothetical protein
MELSVCELSSCEWSDYYYIDYLSKMDKSITVLDLNIDRGCDFRELSHVLALFNLDTLKIEQNYSSSTKDDFIYFIKTLKIKNFTLIDFQSNFLTTLTINDLSKIAPDDCHYVIKYDDDDQHIKYKKGNQKITMIGKFEK